MTPAINAVKKAKTAHTLHHYSHDPSSSSYGKEAAEKLGITEARVFKTLVVQLDGSTLAVAIIPVSTTLGMKPRSARASAVRGAEA